LALFSLPLISLVIVTGESTSEPLSREPFIQKRDCKQSLFSKTLLHNFSGEGLFCLAKFVFSLGIIVCGLSLGYLIRRLVNARRLALPISQEILRKTLQKSALLFVFPITITGAIWIVRVQALSF
jgi:hypothetical protein